MRVLVTLFALCLSIAHAEATYAWWITLRIEPTETHFRGIPARSLSTPLKRLTLLTCKAPSPTFTPEQCAEIQANNAALEYTGDLNGDGEQELAQLAVAEDTDGALRGVLIISSVAAPKNNQVLFLGENGFNALFISEGQVDILPCMECDGGVTLRWDSSKRRYFFEVHPEYG